ncbi:MAG: ABC transporter ATP-binding protein [Dehalococcoidia bacterium]|nr:ABC transporter ATP-binding protein [Dehalococcoidia bacterium]
MVVLKTVDLEQRIGAAVLLNKVSLSVEKGEIFAVIGPTGAGKTTLLRLINLLDRPTAGDIYFDGQKITDPSCDVVKVRRRMAMVFQKPAVFNNKVYENVAYPLKVRGTHGKTERSDVYQLLETIGLGGYARRKARTLSGGEAQRVALARAVVTKPDLLLLDEPTANLDPVNVKMIEGLVMQFNRERGLTVIMSTHDMQQAHRVAGRIGVLMNGRLVQVGSPDDIFYSPDNARIAGFVGMRNLFRGYIVRNEAGIAVVNIDGRDIQAVSDLPVESSVEIHIRPEDVVLAMTASAGSARNSLRCTIRSLSSNGPLCTVIVDCGFPLEVLVTDRSATEMGLSQGQEVYASFKASAVRALPSMQR